MFILEVWIFITMTEMQRGEGGKSSYRKGIKISRTGTSVKTCQFSIHIVCSICQGHNTEDSDYYKWSNIWNKKLHSQLSILRLKCGPTLVSLSNSVQVDEIFLPFYSNFLIIFRSASRVLELNLKNILNHFLIT